MAPPARRRLRFPMFHKSHHLLGGHGDPRGEDPGAQFLTRPLPICPSIADRLPHLEWRRRHSDVAYAERGQCIEDGADDDGECRRASAVAAGLDAEWVARRQHLDDLGREGREIVRAWHPESIEDPHKGWPDAGSSAHSSHISLSTRWAAPPWVWPCTISGLMRRPTSSTTV
jgi:hypothetical protein